MITGSNSGLGKCAAVALAKKGKERGRENGKTEKEKIERIGFNFVLCRYVAASLHVLKNFRVF